MSNPHSDEIRTAIAIWRAGHLEDSEAAVEVAHRSFNTRDPQFTAALALGAMARLAGILASKLAEALLDIPFDDERGAIEVFRHLSDQLDIEDGKGG